MNRGRTSERAQAAVELAFCLPVLVLILGAIYVFGQAFVEVQQVSHAASEGARTAAYNAGSANRAALVTEAVQDSAELNGGRLEGSQLNWSSTGSWAAGGNVTINVTYPLELDFGFVSLDRTITRSRTMRVIQ